MRMQWGGATVAVALLMVSPAMAATGVDCMAERLGDQGMERAINAAMRDRDLPSESVGAIVDCAAAQGWSEDTKLKAASAFTLGVLAESSRRLAIRRGVTPEQLVDLQGRLRAANFRVTQEGLASDTADGEPLFAALRETGLMDHRALSQILAWLALLSKAEDERQAFLDAP